MGENPVVELERVNVYYRRRGGRMFGVAARERVLHDVSLTVGEGEIVGVVGESGCGKTTLAKAILGINREVDGKISLAEGCNPQMVFQDPYGSLNPAKTVGWIMEEPLRLKGGEPPRARRERVLAMLEKVGLPPEIAQRRPRQLSGGQRQRVCIGAALMTNPKLLIADEPVSALDVTIQAHVVELLRRLQEEMGMAVLFISHDLRVVYKICRRVVILRHGRIVEAGGVEEIYFHPGQEYTRQLLEAAGIGI